MRAQRGTYVIAALAAMHQTGPVRSVQADLYSVHDVGFNICQLYFHAVAN